MKVRLPAGTSRARPKAAATERPVRLCPRCGSPRIASDMNFIATPRYVCDDCGFRGAFLVTDPGPREGQEAGPR